MGEFLSASDACHCKRSRPSGRRYHGYEACTGCDLLIVDYRKALAPGGLMSARVAVFHEHCPGRVPVRGPHYFEPTQRSEEEGVLDVRRVVRLRCSYCRSLVRIETRHGGGA